MRPELLDSLVYTLITNHYATLYEIQNYYTAWDALALFEACVVNAYNIREAKINRKL